MLTGLLDLLLPSPCVGCAGPDGPLCAACRPVATVTVAGTGGTCVAAGAYAGGLRAAVLAYKERGHRALAGPLGGLLATAVTAALGGLDPPGEALRLVPVPSARAVARARGGDHVRRLAASAASTLSARGLPAHVEPVLAIRRRVDDSVGLAAADRRRNLAGAFAVAARPHGNGPVVVVDDVVTTGATLAESARALDAAGIRVAAAATVAATVRRR